MPFTIFHLGPAMLIWSIIYPLKDKMTSIDYVIVVLSVLIGSVIPDIQGFYALFFDRNVPLHGFTHTIVGAVTIALLGVIIAYLSNYILDIWQQKHYQLIFVSLFVSIIILHLIPDVVVWSDMDIFWPISQWSPGVEDRYTSIAMIMTWMGMLSLPIFFVTILVRSGHQSSST